MEKGDSFYKIKNELKKSNIEFPSIINLFFLINKFDQSLRIGEYEISPGDSIFSITFKLIKGNIFYHSFHIPEGSVVKDFLNESELKAFCKFKGLDNCNLEGFFHPNTYLYEKNDDLNILLNKAFNKQIELASSNLNIANKELPIKNIKQLLILASILEKESCDEERPKISGVIYNRLNKNMRLQIDSTVIYGIKNFNGNLTKKDLKKNTPFNTYTNHGLPPSPISLPSLSSIISAAHPAKHDYLFFVSKGPCQHEFSESYDQHLEAVKKYQLN